MAASDGILPVRDGESYSPLVPGTSGDVLTSNGSGAIPSYQAVSVLMVLASDPSPTDDTWWMVKEGISPAQMITLKVRIGGTTYPVASVGPL